MPRSLDTTTDQVRVRPIPHAPSTTQELEAMMDFPIDKQRALTNLLVSQRRAMGKTQSQIADEAHVDQTVISTLERKISIRMGWLAFFRVMRAYGLQIDNVMQILGIEPEDGEMQNPRISAIVEGLDDLDEDWQDYALSNIEVWLMGLRQRIAAASKQNQRRQNVDEWVSAHTKK